MAYEAWPELALEDWLDTRETVHMWTQIVGKVQLEMRPFVNQWWEVGLSLSARGLASGLVPLGTRSFQFHFDSSNTSCASRSATARRRLSRSSRAR